MKGSETKSFKGTYLIPHKTVHERMICDMLEKDLDLNHTTLLINKELVKDRKKEFGVSYVLDTYACLCPVIIPIRKVVLGTNNAHSTWTIVVFNILNNWQYVPNSNATGTLTNESDAPVVNTGTSNATVPNGDATRTLGNESDTPL